MAPSKSLPAFLASPWLQALERWARVPGREWRRRWRPRNRPWRSWPHCGCCRIGPVLDCGRWRGCRVVRDGAVGIARGGLGEAAVVVGLGVVGIEFDGASIVGDGAGEIALGEFGMAAIAVGFGEFRIEGNGASAVRDGAVGVALGSPGQTAVAISLGVFGIDLDGAVVVGNAAVEIATVGPARPRCCKPWRIAG